MLQAEPRKFVEELFHDIESSRNTRLGDDATSMLRIISESVFARSAHFILELLQNAEDSGKDLRHAGEIEFSISPRRIRVSNNGSAFTHSNVDAICGVRPSKKPEEGTLGFLGIGFKSVFKISDSAEIRSGDFHFKFDKSCHANPDNVPWQIMPIWVDHPSEETSTGLTTFILPFRSQEAYQQTLAELRKLDVHVFLFLKWLKRLRIIDESAGKTSTIDNRSEKDGILSIAKDGKPFHFAVFRESVEVPHKVATDPALIFYKRQNVKRREVVIAFGLDEENNLQPIDEAGALGSVASFLPLVEEKSGAKFLLQSDFLVQPGREAIQYELSWNHWLVEEAVSLAKKAIEVFKKRPPWGRQFLPLFRFTSYTGQQEFDKLFRPKLKDPLSQHLLIAEVVPTALGGFQRAANVVVPDEGLHGLLGDGDLQFLFANGETLHVVDPNIDFKSLPDDVGKALRHVDFQVVARNERLLNQKASLPNFDEWFRSLYSAMARTGNEYKRIQQKNSRGRFESVEVPIFVLTSSKEIESAGKVYLRSIPRAVQELAARFPEVKAILEEYKFVHECLEGEDLESFLTTKTHVRAIDYERIAREVFLPRIKTTAQKPTVKDLIAYTRLLQNVPSVSGPIWVLTKAGDVKPSNEVFMAGAYAPAEDWERNDKFVPEIDFLSTAYLNKSKRDEVSTWREFFRKMDVKDKGAPNHVASFAVTFTEHLLGDCLTDFVPKDKHRVGYDREARRKTDNAIVKLEIKGQTKEGPVVLDGNEPTVARQAKQNNEPFWVCIVPAIPENPQLWILENPIDAGEFNTLTIDVSSWKAKGRRHG
jgi:hypothetical protein